MRGTGSCDFRSPGGECGVDVGGKGHHQLLPPSSTLTTNTLNVLLKQNNNHINMGENPLNDGSSFKMIPARNEPYAPGNFYSKQISLSYRQTSEQASGVDIHFRISNKIFKKG
jgi:hypothetical protein